MSDFAEIWSYLSRGPLLWLSATLAAYALGDACFRAANRAPIVNPVLIAVACLATLCILCAYNDIAFIKGVTQSHINRRLVSITFSRNAGLGVDFKTFKVS